MHENMTISCFIQTSMSVCLSYTSMKLCLMIASKKVQDIKLVAFIILVVMKYSRSAFKHKLTSIDV